MHHDWEECATELDRCVCGRYPEGIRFMRLNEKVIILRSGKNSLYMELVQRANHYHYSVFHYWYSTNSRKSKGGAPLSVYGSNVEGLLKFLFVRLK